jgi:G:T/U-mismatch repair DNA glycosylase
MNTSRRMLTRMDDHIGNGRAFLEATGSARVFTTSSIPLSELFLSNEAVASFRSRFERYLAMVEDAVSTFRMRDENLEFETSSLIPPAFGRPLCLMLFGNPSTRSVAQRQLFANEANGNIHRFWRVMIRIGCLQGAHPSEMMNDLLLRRTKGTHDLAITSAFEIPTPNSGEWSGLAGLKSLLGREAFCAYRKREVDRLSELIQHLPTGTRALCFQSDAWTQLLEVQDLMNGHTFSAERLPPTRLMYSKRMHEQLSRAILG